MKEKKGLKLRRGGYLAGASAMMLAIVVVVNLLAGQLPSGLREIDLTDNNLYEISEASMEVIDGLTEDVELIVLAEEGTVDARISRYLEQYAAQSGRLRLTTVDPVAHPTEAASYNTDYDSVLVRCEATGRSRTLSFTDLILYSYSYFYAQESEFDVEGQLTAAVSYVTSDTAYLAYQLTGHGEETLGDTAASMLEKANLTLSELDLLREGSVPEDCGVLVINGPETDLSQEELEAIWSYIGGGGRVVWTLSEQVGSMPNWETLLSRAGLELADGYIADLERFYAQFQSYYYLAPELNTGSSLASGLDSRTQFLFVNARGLLAQETPPDGVSVETVLSTSSSAVAVSQDGQTQGTYLLGAVSSVDGETETGSLTVFTSCSLVDEALLSTYASMGNATLFVNAATAGMEGAATSIPAKSLEVTYNTISNPGLWGGIYLFLLPGVTVVLGVWTWLKRRRL